MITGEVRAPRDGAVTIPIVRVPSAERETGGVAVDVVGAGEIAEREPRGLEPADAARPRRHRRRPRVAVDGGVPVHAARRQRAAIADASP